MIALTVDKVDGFVSKLQHKGVKVRWDGWNMVFFKPVKGALRNPGARRLDSEWGFETIVSPNEQGRWLVPYHLARGTNG